MTRTPGPASPSSRRALAASNQREEFGIDFDRVHIKDSRKTPKGRNSIFGGRLNFGGRGDFRNSEFVFDQGMHRSGR